jgi:hypothetical protein
MSEISSILPSILTYPFPKKIAKNKATYFCIKCAIQGNIYARKSNFSIAYCEGNCPPEIQHNTILGPHTSHPSCAGITFEHFHVLCNVCGFKAYLELPSERDQWEK